MRDRMLIDLHSHVLPEFDDGSQSLEMSLAMLRREAEQGVAAVCATSHYYAKQNSIPSFCARRAEALERLTSALPEDFPRVLPAAEVAYFPHMEEQDLTPLCIQGTRTLMLEMPFADWTDLQLETVEALVLDCRYDVVLVHPERFCFSKSNRHKLEKLAELPYRAAGQRGQFAPLGHPASGAGPAADGAVSAAWQRLPQFDVPPAQSQRRKKSRHAKTGRGIFEKN